MPNMSRNASRTRDQIIKISKEDLRAYLAEEMEKIREDFRRMETNVGKIFEGRIASLENEIKTLNSRNTILENRIERIEREQKKKNIVITNLKAPKEKVNEIIRDITSGTSAAQVQLTNLYVRKGKNGDKIMATCASYDEKILLMKEKPRMRFQNVPFYIDDELTVEEELIQFRARNLAREQKRKGGITKVAYKKIIIGDKVYTFNSVEDQFQDRNGTTLEERNELEQAHNYETVKNTPNEMKTTILAYNIGGIKRIINKNDLQEYMSRSI